MNISDKKSDFMCPGCSACANICHKNAIRIKPDVEGFYRPIINFETCTNCAMCIKICPSLNETTSLNYKQPKCYEFIAADDELLFNSSSGGAFGLLAKYIFNQKGIVCGVAWKDDFSVGHVIIEKEDDLSLIQKSKYLQSFVSEDFYRKIKEQLDKGIKVLFSGSPCHVAGLNNFLAKEYDNLLTADILCAQAPSTKIFHKFLDDEYGRENIKSAGFRQKNQGWGHESILLLLQNGTKLHTNEKTDLYQKLYHDGYIKPEHCAYCKFSTIPRYADITLGDFWGVAKKDPELHPDYKKGLSVVIVNNAKGEQALEAIKPYSRAIKEVPLEWVGGNGALFVQRKGELGNLSKRESVKRVINKLEFRKVVDSARKEKFDIGVIGWWYGYNYGSILTNYALHQMLVGLGYSVLMIRRETKNKQYSRISTAVNHAYSFAQKYYNIMPQEGHYDFLQLNGICNTFLVGSDQLWHHTHALKGDDLFLSFADGNKKKISYATSFGPAENHIPPQRDIVRNGYFLQDFDFISVRESSAVDYAKNTYNVDSTHVLDPVFMIPSEEYKELTKNATVEYNNNFLTAYILDPTPEKCQSVRDIAKKLGLDIVVITDAARLVEGIQQARLIFNKEQILESITPENFLYLFDKCKYIVTDSFHGVCFSYIFKKDFSCFFNEKRGVSRFVSLIELFNLKNRRIYENDNISDEMLSPVDFSYADEKIAEMQKFSMEWLKNALQTPKQNKPTPYNLLKRELDDLRRSQSARVNAALNQTAALRKCFEMSFFPFEGEKAKLALKAVQIGDFTEYLMLLKKMAEQFLIIISVKDTPGSSINRDMSALLQSIGLKKDLHDKHWCSYIGVLDKRKLLFEKLGENEEPSTWSFNLDGLQIDVVSKTFRNGNTAQIAIDNIDYSINERGLNIVIFDKESRCFVDSVCFDTHVSTINCRRGSESKWAQWVIKRADAFYLQKFKISRNYENKDNMTSALKDKKKPSGHMKKGWRHLKTHGFKATWQKVKRHFNDRT